MASQQANSGRVRDQPGLPMPEISHITAFASISSFSKSRLFSFAVNRSERKPKQQSIIRYSGMYKTYSTAEILFRIESHVLASEEYEGK